MENTVKFRIKKHIFRRKRMSMGTLFLYFLNLIFSLFGIFDVIHYVILIIKLLSFLTRQLVKLTGHPLKNNHFVVSNSKHSSGFIWSIFVHNLPGEKTFEILRWPFLILPRLYGTLSFNILTRCNH